MQRCSNRLIFQDISGRQLCVHRVDRHSTEPASTVNSVLLVPSSGEVDEEVPLREALGVRASSPYWGPGESRRLVERGGRARRSGRGAPQVLRQLRVVGVHERVALGVVHEPDRAHGEVSRRKPSQRHRTAQRIVAMPPPMTRSGMPLTHQPTPLRVPGGDMGGLDLNHASHRRPLIPVHTCTTPPCPPDTQFDLHAGPDFSATGDPLSLTRRPGYLYFAGESLPSRGIPWQASQCTGEPAAFHAAASREVVRPRGGLWVRDFERGLSELAAVRRLICGLSFAHQIEIECCRSCPDVLRLQDRT